jgi:hypothetical protein
MAGKNEVSSVNKAWTTERFLEFMERLTHEERRVLACLLDDEDSWVSESSILKTLHLHDGAALSRLLNMISAVALSIEMDPGRVYTQRLFTTDGISERACRIALEFSWAATAAGRPSLDDAEDLRRKQQ